MSRRLAAAAAFLMLLFAAMLSSKKQVSLADMVLINSVIKGIKRLFLLKTMHGWKM